MKKSRHCHYATLPLQNDTPIGMLFCAYSCERGLRYRETKNMIRQQLPKILPGLSVSAVMVAI